MGNIESNRNESSRDRPPLAAVAARTKTGSVTVAPAVEEPSVDHGIEESFPASDPVSVSITKVLVASDDKEKC